MIRRLLLPAAAALLVLAPAAPVRAHAVLESSTPRDGERLDRSPQRVVLRFNEPADLRASSVEVIDSGGRSVARGEARASQGTVLTLDLRDRLPAGVYTTTWRVLSRVDGHVTAGAFAFGVGTVPPPTTRADDTQSPAPTPFSAAARAALYAGIALAVGVLASAAFVTRRQRLHAGALPVAVALMIAGAVGIAESQRRAAGLDVGTALGSSVGRTLLLRLLPVVAIVPALRRSATGVWLAVAGAGVVGVLAAHVAEGHAAADGTPAISILVQGLHVTAAGAWIGSIAAVLVVLRRIEPEARGPAASRLSTLATVSVVVVAGTGAARAIVEVGSWSGLTSTSYGRLVIAKIALLLVLVVLGAYNRFRSVARAAERPSSLLRVGVAEVVLGAAVLGATGWMTGLPPPQTVAAAAARAETLVVTGSDFATSVRARLEIRPGLPGANEVVATVADYDTRAPVEADRVSLRLSYLGPVALEDPTVALERAKQGVWRARTAALALEGPWRATLLIQRAAGSVEVELPVRPRTPQQVSVIPGEPPIHDVRVSDDRTVQLYVSPGRSGRNELHATFFESGREIEDLTAFRFVATGPGGEVLLPPARRLSPGHAVAGVDLAPGTWRFDAVARARDGGILAAWFETTIQA